MSKPFDATLKAMLEAGPADWLGFLGHPSDAVAIVDSDIATVTGAADKVLQIGRPARWVLHLEFQTGHDPTLPRRLNVYNSMLEHRHALPVRTTLLLLHPNAERAAVAGVYEARLPGSAEPYRVFRYDVVRIWELPYKMLLDGGLAVLPLAPISDVTGDDLPGVFEVMQRRLSKKSVRRALADELWSASAVLMGLRYEEAFIRQLLQRIPGMKESVTYQIIHEEGAIFELRKTLFGQGKEKFKVAPPAAIREALEKIDNLEVLEALSLKIINAESWEELLGLPAKPARKKRSTS